MAASVPARMYCARWRSAQKFLIGRSYIYGLGAGGELGVTKAIEIVRQELDVSMALTGVAGIEAIGPSVLSR